MCDAATFLISQEQIQKSKKKKKEGVFLFGGGNLTLETVKFG